MDDAARAQVSQRAGGDVVSEREGLDAEFPPHPAAPSCACPRCKPNPYTDPLAPYERPYLRELRVICEAIGYGRVQQVVEDWYEEKCPGWKAAGDAVAANRHRRRTRKVLPR